MLTPALTVAPFGNLMGSKTSQGRLAFSLQWMRVSSRSKIKVGLEVGGRCLRLPRGGKGLFMVLMYCKISMEAVRWVLQS